MAEQEKPQIRMGPHYFRVEWQTLQGSVEKGMVTEEELRMIIGLVREVPRKIGPRKFRKLVKEHELSSKQRSVLSLVCQIRNEFPKAIKRGDLTKKQARELQKEFGLK